MSQKENCLLTAQIPVLLMDALTRVSKTYGMSKSELVRRAITRALDILEPDALDSSAQEPSTVDE